MSDDTKLSERILNAIWPERGAATVSHYWYEANERDKVLELIEGVLADTPIMKHELLRCELKESKAEIERLWAEVERLEARLADVDPHYHEYKM